MQYSNSRVRGGKLFFFLCPDSVGTLLVVWASSTSGSARKKVQCCSARFRVQISAGGVHAWRPLIGREGLPRKSPDYLPRGSFAEAPTNCLL